MIIDITQEEYDLFQKIMVKIKSQDTFEEAIKTKSIDELIGKEFLDKEGIFAGKFNNVYYFLEPNENVRQITWVNASLKDEFLLPTKEDLMFLYLMRDKFNNNCSKNERWWNEKYWTSEKLCNNYSWYVHFACGTVTNSHNQNYYFARGVKKVQVSA